MAFPLRPSNRGHWRASHLSFTHGPCFTHGTEKCSVSTFVCPREWTFISDLGQQSLYSYILHYYIVIPLLKPAVALMPWLEDTSSLSLQVKLGLAAAQVLLSFVVCALMASYPVRCLFSPILEPTYLKKLWTKDGPAKPTEICEKQGGTGVLGVEAVPE